MKHDGKFRYFVSAALLKGVLWFLFRFIIPSNAFCLESFVSVKDVAFKGVFMQGGCEAIIAVFHNAWLCFWKVVVWQSFLTVFANV